MAEEALAACIQAIKSVVDDDEAKATMLCTQFSSAGDAAGVADGLLNTRTGLNTLYLVICGALVFIMHAGFAMLCAGAVRSKNTMNILLQTVMDAAVSAIAFYTLGYGFAYGVGKQANGFIGNDLFGLSEWKGDYTLGNNGVWWQMWFFQWAFAATATTIPAGCVAERFNFSAYMAYSFFIPAFVYPVVAHWVWSSEGWLAYYRAAGKYDLFGSGMMDFAGSGVVHMVGGLSGMMACILVGPRMGRFDSNGNPVEMPGHSAVLVVLGTCLLWFGWYGFNPGSMLVIDSAVNAMVVGRAAVTTTLSGAAGGLACLAHAHIRGRGWDLISMCNGVLVGFVSITAGAHVVEPWAAIIAGGVGGIIFDYTVKLFLKLKIDDPLCAAPMHGICGAWGVLFVGFLAKEEYVMEAYAGAKASKYPFGCFYPRGGGTLLASQVIGILCIAAWVCTLMGLFFGILKFFNKLRISPEEEQAGLDVSKHGGMAYNYDHGLGKPDKAIAA